MRDAEPRPKAILNEPKDAERQGSSAIRITLDDIYMAEYALEPGSEPGTPHYHARHSDTFYVLAMCFAVGIVSVLFVRPIGAAPPSPDAH